MEKQKIKGVIAMVAMLGVFGLTLALNQPGLDINLLKTDVTGLTTVTLADADNNNFGLDGRDFTVTWTAASLTNATTFQQYKIYLIPSAVTDPTTGNIADFTPVMDNITQISQTTWTGPQSLTQDSSDGQGGGRQNFSDGNYKACVLGAGSDNTKITCSAPAAITFDNVADNSAPFIFHAPAHAATASTDAIILVACY